MKTWSFIVGICVVMFGSGCTDDALTNGGVRPVSGDEVQFGADPGHFELDPKQKNNDADTRTVYIVKGEETFANYTHLGVEWESGDEVRIYCPQAAEGFQTADYKVEVEDQSDQYYENGFLVKVGDTGIRWGDSNTEHKFYAFYPTTTGGQYTLEGLKTGTKITAEIPVAQEHGTLYTYNSQTSQQDPDGDWKIIAPDMTFAMMVAESDYTPSNPNFNGTIYLHFTPIVTVLDVVVNGPADASTGSYKVLQVMVYSEKQPIVGKFTYDFATKEFSDFQQKVEGADYNLASVDCMYNGEPLELSTGQRLNVKFFLLPQDIKAGELTIAVLLEGGQVVEKKLSTLGGNTNDVLANITLEQGNIIKVQTPKLVVGEANNWMNLIDKDVYFASQLSLPGSKHSYTYNTFASEANIDRETTYMQSFQSLTIEEQFNRGVRAFDVKVNANRSQAYIYAGGSNLSVTLGDMLTTLKNLVNGSTECVVVSINYVNGLSSTVGTWALSVTSAISAWHATNPNILRTVTSETTMGDMRGKIAILLNCPEDVQGEMPANLPVGAIIGYSSSVRNTTLNELKIAADNSSNVWVQNLYQVNNPEIISGGDYAYDTSNGLLPYYCTVPSMTDKDLLNLKLQLAKALFDKSRENNSMEGTAKLKNLFINDLGGFCVVKDKNSTGYVQASNYRYWGGLIGWSYSMDIATYYNYHQIPTEGTGTANGYDYYGWSDNEPTGASIGGTWFRLEDNSSMGQGGNTALFAEKINSAMNEIIYHLVNEGRTPLGIVYLNFAGINEVTIGGKTYNVQGTNLPSLIMSNNFKFPLVRNTTTAR